MSDESMPEQEDIEASILELVKEFVSRLDIVHEALPQLHPRLIWRRWCRENPQSPRTRATFRKIMKQYPQLGMWKNEWNYFVHGMGCRLTHIHTGEPLEWDAGDKRSFDKNWFVNWLQWGLQSEEGNASTLNIRRNMDTRDLQMLVFPILEKLCSTHKLERHHSNCHILK